jgi:hypothetical protein
MVFGAEFLEFLLFAPEIGDFAAQTDEFGVGGFAGGVWRGEIGRGGDGGLSGGEGFELFAEGGVFLFESGLFRVAEKKRDGERDGSYTEGGNG